MTDIVERLRSMARDYEEHISEPCRQAADEIERLRKELNESDPLSANVSLNLEIERLRAENEYLRAQEVARSKVIGGKPGPKGATVEDVITQSKSGGKWA